MAGTGGKRAGAGRKPSTLKGIAKRLPAWSAQLILAEINANKKWIELATSKDESIVLGTLKFLTEQAYGKAKQSMELDDKRRFDGASRLAELFAGAIKADSSEPGTGRTQ